jgi:hypothetical protein
MLARRFSIDFSWCSFAPWVNSKSLARKIAYYYYCTTGGCSSSIVLVREITSGYSSVGITTTLRHHGGVILGVLCLRIGVPLTRFKEDPSGSLVEWLNLKCRFYGRKLYTDGVGS